MRTEERKMIIVVLCLCVGVVSTCAGKVIYVDADATGANDGTSWVDGYNYLQDALADANCCAEAVEILVAKGTYVPGKDTLHPGGAGGREATFLLTREITLRGGYAGIGETDFNERDMELYETILSGDLNGDDEEATDPCDLLTEATRAENCYHVVSGVVGPYCQGLIAVELDGLTISGGNANGSFSGLDSHGSGGGIGMVYMCYRLKVVGCTFRDNTAQDGAAIGGLRGQIVNCLITNNASAWNGGGASYCWGLVQGCTMEGNYAGNAGGAMYLWGESPHIEGCTFSNNRAEWGGGLFIADAEPNLIDCTFSGNSAVYGGGMHSACFDNPSSPTLTGCAFIENTAFDDGGGMYNITSDATVKNCTFTGNSASRGGGVYNDMYYYNGVVAVVGCTFAGNTATGATTSWGGGGAMYNYCGNQTVTNCLFSDNTAVPPGNALFNVWCVTTMTNCTVSGSEFDPGEGMCLDEAFTHATNCIFRDGIADYDDFSTITYCNVPGDWPGLGNIDVDPLFADPDNGDYHLKSQAGRWDANEGGWTRDDMTSPCIDAGDPMSPIGHEAFPNGGIANMGAYGGTSEASKSYFGKAPCEVVVAGDINGDCVVDFRDFQIMALHWMEER